MEWYYAKDGAQHGPVGETELRELIRSRNLSDQNLVWREGMSEWQPLGQLSEFDGALVAATPPQSQGAGPVSPYQPPQAAGPPSSGYGADIPSYLWQSIVVTLFCCQIFGIIAIVFAAQVDGLKRAGDLVGARAASDKAKTWCFWGMISGLVVIFGYAAVILVAEH